MKFFSALLCLLVVTSATAQSTFPVNGPHDDRALTRFFVNATVHVDPTTVLPSATLVVRDGKVAAVAVGLEPAPGALVTDLSGKHIYPAFVDLYTSYGLPPVQKKARPDRPQYEREANTAAAWNDALKPEYHAVTDFQPGDKGAAERRKAGFAAVLTHRPDGIARGTGALVALGSGKANKQVLRSQAAAFYSFKKGSSTQKYPNSLMGAIALLRQTAYDARWYANTGVQTERNIGLEAWRSNQSLPQVFGVTEKNDLPRVHRIGEEFETSYIIKMNGDAYQRIDEVVRCNFPLIVPLNFPKAYDVTDPYEARLVSLQELKHWESAPSNPARLSAREVPFCLTMEGIDEASLFLKNLRKAVRYGLDTATAIAALTINPATFIGAENALGTLAEGKWANFIVLSGDLFSAESDVLETWIMGERYRHIDHTAADVRGEYNLNIDNHFYTLHITGDKAQTPKAQIWNITDGDTARIKAKFKVQEKLVSLSFNPKDEHYDQVIRLSGNIHKESRIWEGQAQLSSGAWLPWTAIRQRQRKMETKSSSPKAPMMDADAGVVRVPNRAYGYDSIPPEETLWFTGATVWTSGDAGVIEKGEVLVHAGKVLAVGKRLDLAALLPRGHEGVREVNCTGKHLTPGIIDEHAHIAISRGVNEATQASSAEVRIGDVVNPDDINIFRQLSGGVTTIQQLHGSANPIGGQSSIIKLRWGQPASGLAFEDAPGFIKFALGENVKQSNWGDRETIRYPQTRMGVEQVFYDHFLRARAYDEAWSEQREDDEKPFWKRLIDKKQKTEPVLRVDLELEALAEVLNGERFITCHSYVQSEINMLMHVADSLGFTVNTFTHILEGYKVADKMAKHGAAGSTFSDWWAYKYEVNDAIPYNAALMHQQGVLVAMNSDDAEMARRLNQEAAKAVKYGGVREEEALKMVTINPAKMLHIDHRVGSIVPGKDADLVVWSDHPLSVYSMAEETYIDGRLYFDRDQLETLRERDRTERARILSKMMESEEKGHGKVTQKNPNDKEYHCDDVEEEI